MRINYRKEGKYDGERGWPSTPPNVAGLVSWTEYTDGYEEGRKKPLLGVKKQYTEKEKKRRVEKTNKRNLMILAIFLIIVFLVMLIVGKT